MFIFLSKNMVSIHLSIKTLKLFHFRPSLLNCFSFLWEFQAFWRWIFKKYYLVVPIIVIVSSIQNFKFLASAVSALCSFAREILFLIKLWGHLWSTNCRERFLQNVQQINTAVRERPFYEDFWTTSSQVRKTCVVVSVDNNV